MISSFARRGSGLPRCRPVLVVAAVCTLLIGAGPAAVRAQVDDSSAAAARKRRPPRDPWLVQGQNIFRFDTFGDQDFWGGQLRLHEAVNTLTPRQALGLGLKVDVDALPHKVVEQIKHSKVNLDDPNVTLLLLKLNAVVGVTGISAPNSLKLQSIGIQCALCHSTVDDSLAPGIGHRLDTWANRDLNVGGIIAAAPNLQPLATALSVDVATVKKVLMSWGPGKFDAELALDGKAFRPDGGSAAVLIPPAFGLAGIDLHTWTGWGSVTYWNAFVANLEMHGHGTFEDARLNNPVQFPLAVKNHLFDVRSPVDLITSKLAPLHDYQLSFEAPQPPPGSFNPAMAMRGSVLFSGKAACAMCHVPPLFTEPGWNLHLPAEIGIDDFQANRSPSFRYRTSPLRGLWTHTKGGFYHDGRFETLDDVIGHYNSFFHLGLTPAEVADLKQYLLSL